MESSANDKADSAAQAQENPTNPPNNEDGGGELAGSRPRRTPFTNLSQVDADLALARTLQEQERAYMMLRMGVGVGVGVGVGGDGGSDYGSWETASFEHDGEFDDDDYDDASEEDDGGAPHAEGNNGERDAFDEHAHVDGEEEDDNDDSTVELDPSAYPDDESFARALQEAEERDMAARLLALAGIDGSEDGDEYEDEDENEGDNGGNSQDAWEDVDPDELSYEELIALGEVVGTESRGLSAETIASLPSINYKSQENQEGISDSCVICRLDFEDDEALILLSCKHSYHSECINNWLQINKVCPVCSAEVSTPLRS